jgi:Zn-dependent M28 family amino/carboxypeptidase
LELARLALAANLKLPVVFVAFGAEESRVQRRGVLPPKYGSRAYIALLSRAERAAIKGVLNLDMVGAGPIVHIGNSGALWLATYREARKLKMKVALEVSKLSDHSSFEDAHLPVVWFWSGMHPSFHLPSDRVSVIQRAEIERVGALAWATMRAVAA